MKVKDIMNIKVTVIGNHQGYNYQQGLTEYTQTIYTVHEVIYNLGYRYKDAIQKLRENYEYGSKEYKLLKQQFPCWMVGGTFPLKDLHDESILTYSNIIAIDIDKGDNTDADIDSIVTEIYKLPYVIGYSKSISGKGYYVLVLVEDGKKTTGYYKYIANMWAAKYKIKIDNACTNIGRKRFLSYDENIKIKDDEIDITPWRLTYIEIKDDEKTIQKIENRSISINEELIHKTIKYLVNHGLNIDYFNCKDNSTAYNTWYYIGCDFAYFTDGFILFEKFSTNSTKYNDTYTNINSKFKQCKCKITIDEIGRKYCGIAKKLYGKFWINKINEQELC